MSIYHPSERSNFITLFLCGDVMTGRGIDQILPHPGDPRLHEPFVADAREYVALAERLNGPIPKPDALSELERMAPDVRIINLETAVTRCDDYWQGKGINYRMHPDNFPCITAAGINYCALANNHVLDWGYPGLDETLVTLKKALVESSGAGHNLERAAAPAVLPVGGKGRVIVFSFGMESSGITWEWAATADKSGVNLLRDLSDETVRQVAARVEAVIRPGDIVVASIHWGGNWGYAIPGEQVYFAHQLIDEAGIDVVYGHSSHHVKGIEVYRGKPILYGCGDFLNDYEGIPGFEEYRGDLALMYFVCMDPSSARLIRFEMIPMRIRRFRVNRASTQESRWLCQVLNQEGEKLRSRVERGPDNTLRLHWMRSGEG
jgi:poly-gamma-glutamate synthesis protein (capsule biosynthesis protein)